MTPCNDSHENNSSEPSGRTRRHAFGKNKGGEGSTGQGFRADEGRKQCKKTMKQQKTAVDFRQTKSNNHMGLSLGAGVAMVPLSTQRIVVSL